MSTLAETKKAGLHEALIAARMEIPAIPKTAENPHYRNKYATLGDILGAVLPVLHRHGLSLSGACQDGCLVVAVVKADTGEVLESRVPLVGATDMQRLGGAISYAFRYGVGALLALELEDDDDGNKASGVGVRTLPEGQSGRPQPPRATTQRNAVPTPSGTRLPGSCPHCGAVGAIIQGKPEYGGGWLCYKKKGGCGAKYEVDPRSPTSNVDNPTGEPDDDGMPFPGY